jgi:hypothetical protein
MYENSAPTAGSKLGLVVIATAGALALILSGVSRSAMATPSCGPGCTVVTTTEPADGPQFGSPPLLPDLDNTDLTFLAVISTGDQNNTTIANAVDAFLANESLQGGAYFGRNMAPGGSGTAPGNYSFSITQANGGLTGTWTFNPGTTGDTAGYIALHDGGGPETVLYEINAGFTTGGPFNWDMSENVNGGGQSGALSNFDLFSGSDSPPPVPEPASLMLLGTALAGLGVFWRWRRKT